MLLALSLLVGCATGGVISISAPNVLSSGKHAASMEANGTLRAGTLSVSVKPQNARVGLLTVGPLVPFIPVGSGNELGKGKPFQVIVQFETAEPVYTFRTGDASLIHGGKVYRPALSAGPLSRTDVPRELQRAARGHDWICNDTFTVNGESLLRDVSVPLFRSCFVLQFPVITPDPDQPFDLRLHGVKRDGQALELPTIEFQPTTIGGYGVLG